MCFSRLISGLWAVVLWKFSHCLESSSTLNDWKLTSKIKSEQCKKAPLRKQDSCFNPNMNRMTGTISRADSPSKSQTFFSHWESLSNVCSPICVKIQVNSRYLAADLHRTELRKQNEGTIKCEESVNFVRKDITSSESLLIKKLFYCFSEGAVIWWLESNVSLFLFVNCHYTWNAFVSCWI